VKWKTFTLLYGRFIQDNTYQSLAESGRFCATYDKKHFGMFFSVQSVESALKHSRMIQSFRWFCATDELIIWNCDLL